MYETSGHSDGPHSLEDGLLAALLPAFEAVGGKPADPVLRRSGRCDYQANGALSLARRLGTDPYQVASRVADLVRTADRDRLFREIEVAKGGFVNLTVREEALEHFLRRTADDPLLGIRPAAVAQTIVVDYSHPNAAKEMHVGHLRTTIIGDALVRLLTRLGHRIVRRNHIGDWGTPFGMLIEHLRDIGADATAAQLSVGDLNGFYRAAREKFDADPGFADRSRARVVTLQGGDQESRDLWRLLVDQSIVYFQTVYEKLDVTLEPADIFGESSYNPMLAGVVEDLRATGDLVESEGALCCFPPGFLGRGGEPLPLIVRKSDGGYGYAATDLAAVRDRIGNLGADRILYVVGAPQREHLAMCFAVAHGAGWVPENVEIEHVEFGSVLGPDRRPFRTRAGVSVRLIDLLDEAVHRADAVVQEKNPALEADERAAVARAVGIGAVKYAELSVDRVRDYVFEWSRMLSFDGNTGPYLQYAFVRACSVLRKNSGETGALGALTDPRERRLALALLGYGAAVAEAVHYYAPHRLCSHLHEIAGCFTAFYESCPILGAEDDVRRSRLGLTELTARVLRDGLGLLGIATPERL